MVDGMEGYVLEMRNIAKSFPGVKALDGVNLKVRPASVHVVVGENGAGKSTLMKIIRGEYAPDQGEIIFKGTARKHGADFSIDAGIAMIHQELNPILEMTIGENLFVGREPESIRGVVNYKKLYRDAQALLDRLNIPFDTTKKMLTLSVAGQQLIEIARAISRDASVILMDEPTSAISVAEVEILFKQIAELKASGTAIVYITHKMDEIFRIADDITVLRDGKWVASGSADEFTSEKIISLMVGRTVTDLFPKVETEIGEVVLEVKGLTQESGRFKDVSFQARRGEILGFAGLVGAGRSEVMRAVFGLDRYDSGEVFLNGERIDIKHPDDAIRHGIAMVTEDRRKEGTVALASARENIVMATLRKFRKVLWVNKATEKQAVGEIIEALSIKVSSPEQIAANLSGGNQQKVVLAKWLLQDLRVLIVDEPTRGIDVGSKAEIHKLLSSLAQQGVAIVMVSSELPEIIGMSDRVVVMRAGIVAGELEKGAITPESIMRRASIGKGQERQADE